MSVRTPRTIALTVFICATLLSSRPVLAQFSQQGGKLVASDATGTPNQGYSVAVSADGNTALVGGRSDNTNAGAAWVYTRNASGIWTQQALKLVGTGATAAARQGTSVALSADGNTAIVGGPAHSASAGAVWVFTRSAGVWSQQAGPLTGSGAVGVAQQGTSVTLSADGNTAVVGGPGDNGNAGAAWVLIRIGTVWSQQGSKLVGTGAVGTAQRGTAVSLSADGNTAMVGGSGDNATAGAVWVWTRDGSLIWSQQGAKLVASDSSTLAGQGSSVSLSGDGNTAIIGGPGNESNVGAAWAWTRTGGVWTQQGGKLVASDAVGSAVQGRSVSLSSDGNTALVGGDLDSGSTGAAWVWGRTAGVWTQRGNKLVASDYAAVPSQGFSVSLSADARTAIIGGPGDDGNSGAAWAFVAPPVTNAPAIVTQPANQTVAPGGTATFTAAASGDPTPTVQWQVSTNGGTSFSDISGATSTTYSFTVAAADNGRQFRAVFTNSAGTATSNAATLTVTSAPAIVTQPTNQTVAANSTATFTAAASGNPTPTVQWQVSTNGGSTFTNVAGATGTAHSFTATAPDNGKQFRAVFSNSAGTATTTAASLSVTLPRMAIDKTSMRFAALTTGPGGPRTPPQTVRLTQIGPGTVNWTAASTVPWLVVSPTVGSGPATLTIDTQTAPGLTDAQTGRINFTLSGSGNTVGPINVTLTIVANAPPFGSFDTPVGDATVLSGSVAVTGWTLDNVGVQRVELWRDLQAGETTTPFSSTPTDPRNGKVFIANATFVDGARPDIEGLYPAMPVNQRAGWGYLMLTWGLHNQGNGTYRLHAFALDQENNFATIGSKTIIVNNNAATKPFGAIDTPAFGGEASGPNFGWALTPKVNNVAVCKIQPSGVQVSIDSGPLQPVVYGTARTDIAAAFPGFSNSAAAGGHYIFDWSTLTNGVHTIGWLVTDDCNRSEGVGSRFFTVSTSQSLLAGMTAASVAAPQTESSDPVTVARGHGELPEILTPGEAGSRIVEIKQGERIEMRLPRGFESAYQIVNGGQHRALPIGATWDAASGIFSWEPAAGFLGRYRLVFSNGLERISVRVIVTP